VTAGRTESILKLMREMWDEELSQRTTLQCVRDAIVSSGPGRGVWTGKSQSCPRFVLCLGPDTVCIGISNSVGGRRIPSVDRAALRAASTELRSVDLWYGPGLGGAPTGKRGRIRRWLLSSIRMLRGVGASCRSTNKIVDTTVRSISSAYLHVDDALYRKRRRQWEKKPGIRVPVSHFLSSSQHHPPLRPTMCCWWWRNRIRR